MSISGLEKLDVWKNALAFAVRIHQEFIPLLPLEEKWSLAQQIRRSAQSIPANIAEGHGRFYYQENVRFCYIARGSLEETLSHLAFAQKIGYLPVGLFQSLAADGEKLNKLINGYLAFLKQSKRGANEPGANYAARELPPEYSLDDQPPAPSEPNLE